METVQYAEQLHQALSVLFPLCSSEVREALFLGFDFINRSHSSQPVRDGKESQEKSGRVSEPVACPFQSKTDTWDRVTWKGTVQAMTQGDPNVSVSELIL